ncbi:MAG: hypothetical protein EXR07_20315 [Acetobacteraceae bacterium]|nr:hypothetical protein [Acetobacteraceae bacterium]
MTDRPVMAEISPASADLLLAVARSVLTANDLARARHAIAAIDDWTPVIETALAQGIAGMLCHHVLACGQDLLPGEIADAAETYTRFGTTEYARAVRELRGLIDALAVAGVRAVPYKGPMVAALCYAEPAIRGCRDLDFLIDKRDIPETMAVLGRLGYRSMQAELSAKQTQAYFAYNGQDTLIADGLMPVEPHWALGPRTLHADAGTEALFRRAGTVVHYGREIPSFSREDTMLICGLHGSKEEWSRLVWIADIAELLRSDTPCDWTSMLDRADRAGVRRMVTIGVGLARRLLDAPVPAELARAIASDPMSGRLAEEAAGRLFTRRGITPSVHRPTRFRFLMRERLRDRLRYAAATLFTARVQHFRFLDLPAGLGFLYPFVRIGHDYLALPLWRLAHARRGR